MSDVLSLCTPILRESSVRRFIFNPFFPLTFWILNLLELEKRGVFDKKPTNWTRSFIEHHIKTRISCFATIYRRLHPVLIGKITEGFSLDETTGGYCNHCGQCCFFFGGLGNFPEPWFFPNRWKRFFTDGLGRNHLFCAFLWEWRHTGKSLCAIYPWRPIVCDLFGKEECQYYLEAPHLPYAHLGIARHYISSILRAHRFH
ncbi:MAG: hypothetical protein WHS38_07015 [Thermodesulforhabdaceae bacterium]